MSWNANDYNGFSEEREELRLIAEADERAEAQRVEDLRLEELECLQVSAMEAYLARPIASAISDWMRTTRRAA